MTEVKEKVKARLPRRRSLMGRVFGVFLWGMTMFMLLAVLLAVALYFGYQRRVMIVNMALREFAAPLRTEVGEIEFPEKGRVVIRDLHAWLPEDGLDRVQVPEAELRYRKTGRWSWEIDTLTMRRPAVFVDDAMVDELLAEGGEEPVATEQAPGGAGDIVMDFDFNLGRFLIEEGRFSMDVAGLPTASGTIDFESAPLALKGGRLDIVEAHRLRAGDIELRMRGTDEAMVRVPGVEVAVVLPAGGRSGGAVTELKLDAPVVVLDQEGLGILRGMLDAWGGETEASGSGPGLEGWRLGELSIMGGRIEFRGVPSVEGPAWPDISLGYDMILGGVEMRDGEMVSDRLQEVALRDIVVSAGAEGRGDALLETDRLLVNFFIEELVGGGQLEQVHLDGVRTTLTKGSTARLLPIIEGLMAAEPGADSDGDEEPVVWRAKDIRIDGGEMYADGAGWQEHLPRLAGAFRLETLSETSEDDVHYRFELGDVNVSAAMDEEERVNLVKGASFAVDFSARGLQETKAIDHVRIDGVRVSVGPALTQVVDAIRGLRPGERIDPGAEKVVSIVAPNDKRWRIDRLELTGSEVTINDLVPGLPVVSFRVQTDKPMMDIYLDGQRTESEELHQRLELFGLRVVSPLNPLLTVVDLRTIFVEFTLNGLLNQEIEVVEVLNPEVFVGQHLFWYVDHYRSLFKEEAKAGAGEAEGVVDVEIDDPEVDGAAIPGWDIKSLGVYNGKLVFAPKGYAVGENPFPFGLTSSLIDGEVDLSLTIPKGDYLYPDMKLELVGLTGQVLFNLPAQTVDNNLVESLTVERVRFREYEAAEVYVTVTYDETGIYAEFGGNAYAGYINGAANIYIGEPYQWDGWVSGVDVDLEAFTSVLQPAWVSMAGVASGKFVVEGVEMMPGKATADFKMDTPGELHIERMDQWLEEIPEEWSQLEKTLTRISLEDFRDYAFDVGHGQLDFDGKNGELGLFLSGPLGKRDFSVYFHDERSKDESDADSVSVASE